MTSGDGKCFYGWIKRSDIETLEARMQAVDEDFAWGRIVIIDHFYWEAGGGVCTKGIVNVL